MMTPRDMALAALTSVIWGLAFVAIKLGLDSFSAAQLTVLRFLVAAVPVFFVARPALSFGAIVLIGLTLFTGQFLLLFFAYSAGLPAALASVSQQMQVFFTVLLAAAFLHDIPTLRQCAGMAVAFAGLAAIALTTGSDLPPLALGLGLAAAFSWAVGNVLVKRRADVAAFPLVVWCSLVPPLPAFLVAAAFDRGPQLPAALVHASWLSIGAALYLGIGATAIPYAIWGRLLQRYPAGAVAPFALLAPYTGILASTLAFGEVFGALRYAGMALILAGLAVIVLPALRTAETSRPVRKPGSARAR